MTRLELEQRILRALNDSPTDPVFWTLEEIRDVIQEGQEILAEEVQALKRTVLFPRHDGLQWVNLAAVAPDCMAPFRIWLPDQGIRLEPRTMRWLDQYQYWWLTITGTLPLYWYPISWDCFGIWPGEATGSGTLEISYLAWPTAMQDDWESPEYAEPDQDALVTYGVYLGLLKQWDMPRAMERWQQFIARFTDATARDDLKRIQAAMWQRQANGHGHSDT